MKNEIGRFESFKKTYSEEKYWNKVYRNAQKAGAKLIYFALCFFYSLQKESTPKWAKSIIIGALGYFISPIDGVPDVAPVIGYSDDLVIIMAAFAVVAKYIDQECRDKAKHKYREIFNSEYKEETDKDNAA